MSAVKMTTGSFSSGSMPNFQSGSWNGEDGKYAISAGKRMPKYNNYTKTLYTHTGNRDSIYHAFYHDIGSVGGASMNSNAIVKAQSNLVSSIKGHDFNLGVFAAEGKETVSLVKTALSTVVGTLVDLKHGRFESAARRLGTRSHVSRLHPKDVSGRWLELQYGWLPLINDVYESAKALERVSSGPRTMIFSGQSRHSVEINTSTSPSNFSGFGTCVSSSRTIYRMSEDISVARTLGLTDPLTIAWELIPYSFIVDWFIPIGTYLENLNVIPKLRGEFCTTNVVTINSKSAVINYLYYKGCSSTFSYVRVFRTRSSGLSTATPSFKSLPEAMSPSHIWNGIALAHQRLG